MAELHSHLVAQTNGQTLPENCIVDGKTRVSVLLDGVLRIEYSETGVFTDLPTQSIWYRNHGGISFTQNRAGKRLRIRTARAAFTVDMQKGRLLYVSFGSKRVRPNARNNLKGTARTLDGTFGPIPLQDGVVSKDGLAVLDDSKSLVLLPDGMVSSREAPERDLYVFAYDRDYAAAVQALYALAGAVPLVPRFVLGNWWSRYYPYTQAEYESLMQTFSRRDIPLTVATIDMDWHWVDLEARFGEKFTGGGWGGAGWTGYSWNTDLFPDPQGFLRFLHEQGLKTTVNLHPADGVRWFEDCYAETAKAMGIDPKTKETVSFDIADAGFINTYFDCVHHPHEKNGVDFWWIDWQQGTKSRLDGLDPLWSLNHYHTLDSGRSGKRPLILSRYAGIGSHRYPLGFSGDTAMNWRVLRFQPYFTVTAANCGYTWWSHDIGGHHFGEHSDELYVRWVQFGVFSPILRLHSTQNDLFGKEPWNYAWEAQTLATEALRLRHKLIPYLYSMNARTHRTGRALCEPLYYTDPVSAAFECKNGYMFGTELLVCPVTSKCDRHTKRAETTVYLPQGRWTNFFTGEIYTGGQTVRVHSDMHSQPVFAKAGAIIPLSLDTGNAAGNPSALLLRLYRGDGQFTLYEDDGETLAFADGDASETEFELHEDGKTLSFCLSGGRERPYMPSARSYTLQFADVANCASAVVLKNGESLSVAVESTPEHGTVLRVPPISVADTVSVVLSGVVPKQNPPFSARVRQILTLYNGVNAKKTATYNGLKRQKTLKGAQAAAARVKNRRLRAWLLESLCAMEEPTEV